MDKIKLSNVTVVFANLKDEGFGKSITVNVTDPEIQKKITEWVQTNKIGKGDKAGKPNFKEYQPEGGEKTIQYAFKINDYTKFVGRDGLTAEDLGYGAEISLIAQAFEYDNKFGKGTSASLSAVLIEKAVRTSADDDVDELLMEAGIDPEEVKETKAESGYDKLKETAQKIKSELPDMDEIDLSGIPF